MVQFNSAPTVTHELYIFFCRRRLVLCRRVRRSAQISNGLPQASLETARFLTYLAIFFAVTMPAAPRA